MRGLGGFVRSSWYEVGRSLSRRRQSRYTIKKFEPDRHRLLADPGHVDGLPYAGGSRYLSLIGGVCMKFYDWYRDLPPASPQVWGEQTDVPELGRTGSNANFIIAWGSNVPQTRTPDAHFFTEVRYKGTKTAR